MQAAAAKSADAMPGDCEAAAQIRADKTAATDNNERGILWPSSFHALFIECGE